MLNLILKIIAWITLIVLIMPAVLYLANRMELGQAKWIMLVATIGWFVTATISSWNTKIQ